LISLRNWWEPSNNEEIDVHLPKALINEMEITVFVDLDYAHDKVMRRSRITVMIIFVGRTPVMFSSKRQGSYRDFHIWHRIYAQ
jgi:hypothetical protein